MKKLISLILAALMLCGTLVLAASAEDSPFIDVKTSRWSYGAIVYAKDHGYMDGVGGGKFDPAGTMTRGMVVTVLYRMEDTPTVKWSDSFTDVKAGKYYSNAVIWAKDSGIVNGITETTFEPGGKITREQLATMLARYAEFKGYDTSSDGDLTKFPDADKVHGYAKTALMWATGKGLIGGVKSGDKDLLDPRGNATREQFAAILKRFDETFADGTLEYAEPKLISQYTEPDYPLVTDADVYVAVDGDDANPGTFDKPVATFSRAAELVRAIKTTKTEGDFVVAFKAGDYGPQEVVLREEDSGTQDQRVVYCAYGDGDVIFNNGIDVPFSSLTELGEADRALFNGKFADRIRKADLSGRLAGYDPRNVMVLGDAGAMTLARFPNKYGDGTDNLIENAHETLDGNHIVVDHPMLTRRFPDYHTMDGLLLYGYLTTGWYKDLLSTDEYNAETGVFRIPHPEQGRMGQLRYLALDGFDSRAWSKIAVVNVSEELDAPGEFWIDAESETLYVFDPDGDYHITGGGSASMITAVGTEYLTFRGLSFKNSEGHMIHAANHPRGITIDGCTFVGCSDSRMVTVTGGNKTGEPLDLTVKNSYFSTVAATALHVDGRGNDKFDTGRGVLIDNNYFTLAGLSEGCTGAVNINCPFAVVTHNHFYRCYWEDIDFRNCVNLRAEYNVFEESCYNGDDTGALQGFRDQVCSGNVTRYNLFLNIRGGTNGRYGLYLDGTSGMTVESNIFYNCPVAVMNNGNSKMNNVINNVFISKDGVINECVVHNEGTPMAEHAVAEGNWDFVKTDEDGKWCYQGWNGAFEYFNSHPEDKAKAEELWPGYFDISMDFDDWQKPEFFMNSSVLCRDNVSIKAEGDAPGTGAEEINIRYCTFENNRVYLPTENPLFVNPTRGDYRMVEGATIDGVEFPNIPFENIGRY